MDGCNVLCVFASLISSYFSQQRLNHFGFHDYKMSAGERRAWHDIQLDVLPAVDHTRLVLHAEFGFGRVERVG
jgi:hypothetical protein